LAAAAIEPVVVDCPTVGEGLDMADFAGLVFFGLAPIVFVRPKASPQAKATVRSSRWATLIFFCIAQCGTVPLPFNWNVRSSRRRCPGPAGNVAAAPAGSPTPAARQ
jgi:hypothetical protein